jgi:hypothetical protein
MCDVAMPLRRRRGAADGPEGGCLPHAYEGSFDGVAPAGPADAGFWGGSSWFAAGTNVAAARMPCADESAVPSGEGGACVASSHNAAGGAVSQNRLSRGAVQVQPFKPLSSTRALDESRLDAEDDWSKAPAFTQLGARVADTTGSDTRFGATPGRTCSAEVALPCGFVYSFERRRWELEHSGAAVTPAAAASEAASCKRARDATTHFVVAEPGHTAEAAVEALRALRLRRHTISVPAAAPAAARASAPAVTTPPRMISAAKPRAAWSKPACAPACAQRGAAHDDVAAAEAVCWSQFRLSCGRLVYVRAEAVTAQMASGWARDASSWPAIHVLETSAAARAAAALPACVPGPRADAELEARVRDEVAAWADAEASETADNDSRELASAASAAVEEGAGAGAQQALVQSLFRGARRAEAEAKAAADVELEEARAWAQRLEAALIQAGIPLPPRC